MSANIDMSNERANIAFLGSKEDIWHRLGQQMEPGQSIESWATMAGLNWTAVPCEAYGLNNGEYAPVADRFFFRRSDTGHMFNYCASDRYQAVQPVELLDWFSRFISVDDRFELDVAGSLKAGEIIWATAKFNGDLTVAGERHVARVLMSTTFDGSGATINQMTVTRVVCNNTLDAALSDSRAVVRTRHNTKFNADSAGKQLARLAQGVETFKACGDAMAQVEMAKEEVSAFFKEMLEIPSEGFLGDVSTRKQNQYSDLCRSYGQSISEGAAEGTAWSALQVVTRYVDHERSTRGGTSEDEARVLSSQFGSGAAFKGKAMELLMPRIKDKVLVDA